MADIFDVLADGTRRELLSRLQRRGGEASVSELVAELGISQPTVSKHLKVLREHGLVAVREEGQHRFYRVDSAPLAEIEAWLAPFLSPGGASAASGAARVPGGDRDAEQEAASTVFAAWAGAEVGDRVGRVAAETAHSARIAFEAAQEKLQGAQQRVRSIARRGPRPLS